MHRIVLADKSAVAAYAADLVEQAISADPTVAIGLAGGSTPEATHIELASRGIDWSRSVAWMTDERWVSPDDPESNQGMVRRTLIDAVDLAFLAPDTTLPEPVLAANEFASTLRAAGVGVDRGGLAMLGMGDDGHTASLFPGSTALDDVGSYTATWVEKFSTWRLTATYSMLAAMDSIVFLVTGEGKAAMIEHIAHGGDAPAAQVEARGEVVWILDEAAASRL